MFRVDVPIPSIKELPLLMSRMREWLDHWRIDVPFECTREFCRVDFASENAASAFAAEFGGAVCGDHTPSKWMAG